jgi:hypothetical protein
MNRIQYFVSLIHDSIRQLYLQVSKIQLKQGHSTNHSMLFEDNLLLFNLVHFIKYIIHGRTISYFLIWQYQIFRMIDTKILQLIYHFIKVNINLVFNTLLTNEIHVYWLIFPSFYEFYRLAKIANKILLTSNRWD